MEFGAYARIQIPIRVSRFFLFLYYDYRADSCVQQTHTHTERDHATFVARGRIFALCACVRCALIRRQSCLITFVQRFSRSAVGPQRYLFIAVDRQQEKVKAAVALEILSRTISAL